MNSDSQGEGGRMAIQNLVRGRDGRFADSDLTAILLSATEADAGTPGAHSTPVAMHNMTTVIIQQARNREMYTLNQFRSYLGLKCMINILLGLSL